MIEKIRDKELTNNQAFGVVMASAGFFGLMSAYFGSKLFLAPNQFFASVVHAKIFLTSFNVIVLSALTYNYLQIYREVPTSMSRGLTMFSGALLLYAVTSSPLIHVMSGFELLTVGPFTYVPDMFVTIAASVILYESQK